MSSHLIFDSSSRLQSTCLRTYTQKCVGGKVSRFTKIPLICCLETVNVCDGVPIRVVDTETFLRMSENLLVEKETFRNHKTYEGSFETFH